ncbi:MAG TPA: hypothetical protein VGF99_12785 [Myxococcota bacterium]
MRFISAALFAPRSASSHDPLLRELVARFFLLEAFVATRPISVTITGAVVEHARATLLFLRDICCARHIDGEDRIEPITTEMPDEALLQHERDLVGRLARLAAAGDDEGLAFFCRGWLAARPAGLREGRAATRGPVASEP